MAKICHWIFEMYETKCTDNKTLSLLFIIHLFVNWSCVGLFSSLTLAILVLIPHISNQGSVVSWLSCFSPLLVCILVLQWSSVLSSVEWAQRYSFHWCDVSSCFIDFIFFTVFLSTIQMLKNVFLFYPYLNICKIEYSFIPHPCSWHNYVSLNLS